MNGIREISGGVITTIGGNGAGISGDGGPAPDAEFVSPQGIAVGPGGVLAVADNGGYRARKLSPPAELCTYAVSTPRLTIVSSTQSGNVVLTGNPGCSWTATSVSSWITVTSSPSSGSGAVTFSMAPNNTGAPRIGTLVIGGQTVTVVQLGAGPPPTINALTAAPPGLSQAIAPLYGSGLILTVNGQNFDSNSSVFFGSAQLPTTFVGPTQLIASVPASQLTLPGARAVTAVSSNRTSNAFVHGRGARRPQWKWQRQYWRCVGMCADGWRDRHATDAKFSWRY